MLQSGDARSETSPNKDRKQIDWRRNKVKEFLVRGYSQFQIAKILHVSQPTISRDIDYILNQSYFKYKRDFGVDLFYNYQKAIFGLDELLIKTWEVIDNPRTDIKQKLKAISLAQNLHNQLFEYKKIAYDTTKLTETGHKLAEREKDLEKREKALQACFKEDATKRIKTLGEIKLRQQTQLLLETTPEERYRLRKKNWMAHDSSWVRRGLNKYDNQGCNQFTGCVRECSYYDNCGTIEDEEWLKINEEDVLRNANRHKAQIL